VAAALLDKETIDGSEVGRLVDEADRPVRAGNGDSPAPLPAPSHSDALPSPLPPDGPLAPEPLAPPPVVTTGWPPAAGASEATG